MAKVARRGERAVLVGTSAGRLGNGPDYGIEELKGLAESAGALVTAVLFRREVRPDPATFIGPGKVEELRRAVIKDRADLVVFDDELTPVQAGNLGEILATKVLDRTGLILDIFSLRARTKEAKLQVEKAQLEYILPRLAGEGKALSRLGGGIGARGPGETKLETDRRKIRRRMMVVNKQLKEVRGHRDLQRSPREKRGWPLLALVGYTSAGKSTLFKAITGAEVETSDRLFSTLDPTLRKVTLPDHQEVFLADTVGFISKLPHQLVEAFRATLEETVRADLLLHVLNLAAPEVEEEYAAVSSVLRLLEIETKPQVTVLNKKDLVDNEFTIARWQRIFPEAVVVSARTGEGIPLLLAEIMSLLAGRIEKGSFFVPYAQGRLLSLFHEKGRVLQKRFLSTGVFLEAELPRLWFNRLQKFKSSSQ